MNKDAVNYEQSCQISQAYFKITYFGGNMMTG